MNKFLYEYSSNVFSQNGEDGINQEIFKLLGITSGVTLEIGACDGFHCSNTANLWSKNENFKSILIESNNTFWDPISSGNLKEVEKKYQNVQCFHTTVTKENSLEKIIDESKFEVTEDNFVLCSIDVDGSDMIVAESLGKYKPKVLILEPNGCFIEKTNPIGTTILEWITWAENTPYEFIGMSGILDKEPGNMYFIREDLKDNFKVTEDEWKYRGILVTKGKKPGGMNENLK